MRLIRKATSQTIPLENGFLWSDEFDWKPIEQNQERAIDGTRSEERRVGKEC